MNYHDPDDDNFVDDEFDVAVDVDAAAAAAPETVVAQDIDLLSYHQQNYCIDIEGNGNHQKIEC